jgi:hypothetical protein
MVEMDGQELPRRPARTVELRLAGAAAPPTRLVMMAKRLTP